MLSCWMWPLWNCKQCKENRWINTTKSQKKNQKKPTQNPPNFFIPSEVALGNLQEMERAGGTGNSEQAEA